MDRPPPPPRREAFRAVLEGMGVETTSDATTPVARRVGPERPDRRDTEPEPDDRAKHSAATLPLEVPRTFTIREPFVTPAMAVRSPEDPAQMQLLAETMLRTLRIGGDGRGGHEARLEIGRGPWAGAAIRLVTHEGRLRAEITGPGHVDTQDLATRLEKALQDRGLTVVEVEIR